ncbi:MAG: Spo0E family sporulation regulatory protein-aspartic acid phosphatase [Bacillota bacterium]|nr:Spo0E family sporulation regulatory protein-aspartic acid phosphatase [Bacillota bacterium]
MRRVGHITETRLIDQRIGELRARLRQLFESGYRLQDEGVLEISRAIDALVVARMSGGKRTPSVAAGTDFEQ